MIASDDALSQTPDKEVGIAIKSVAYAIDNCGEPGSLDKLVYYGTDTRYYRIVRAWLIQRLQEVELQRITDIEYVDCLQGAIRRIDLE